jgi:LytS/YehU family sensor histidine kinase
MKNYYLRTGLALSFFIAIVASVPRMIRLETDYYRILTENLIYNFFYAFLVWIGLYTIIVLKAHWPVWLRPLLALAFCIGLSFVYHTLAAPLAKHIPLLKGLQLWQQTLMLTFRAMVIGSFLYFVIYYLNLLLETQRARLENEQLKQENLQARLHSLQQQVSPHFLFNSLHTLQSIATEQAVKQYIVQLSHVYRYLLNYNESTLASISQEISFLDSYMYILKERYEEALQLEIRIADALMPKCIPPLSLQILVENALKHNVVSLARPLRIQVYNEELREGEQWIVVSNTFQPKRSVDGSTGKGLSNISDRYHLLADQTIEIIQKQDHFVVKIPVLSCS